MGRGCVPRVRADTFPMRPPPSAPHPQCASRATPPSAQRPQVCLETLMCFRRAGADIILTYYAKQASIWLMEDQAAGK